MTYKDFDKIYVGESEAANLIVAGPNNVTYVHFGKDDAYMAYEVFGDNVTIGSHYALCAQGDYWLKIYDDTGRAYYKGWWDFDNKYKHWRIYRAGEMGMIIHWGEGGV